MAAQMSALDSHVLVLNRNYQPVAIAKASRAFSLLFAGVVKALDTNYATFDYAGWAELAAAANDQTVRTPRHVLRVPKIVVLQAYDRLPRVKVRFSRHNIYLRDDHTCQYCGKKFPKQDLNLDHVVPRSQGGIGSWLNIVCSCRSCNSYKDNLTPEQAGMRLLRKPFKPTWSQLFTTARNMPAEWLPYVDPTSAAYWNTELLAE